MSGVNFKVILVGSPNVGKTTLIEGLENNVDDLNFKLEVQEVVNLNDLGDSHKDVDAGIIMFSLTEIPPSNEISEKIISLRTRYPGLPISICGNKCDLVPGCEIKVLTLLRYIRSKHYNIQYYNVCARSGFNSKKLFLGMTNTHQQC